jgi:DNA invertase Pin-like site-specific DNA recombinase
VKTAAIYMRVSTRDQHAENQLQTCLKLCTDNGWAPFVVEETGSGAKVLTGWTTVMGMAQRREIAAVIVWALDRVGRSLWSITESVHDLDEAGVRLLSVQEPWLDVGANPATGGPNTRDMLIHTFAWVAAFERHRLIERTKTGLDVARKKGRVGGRPRTSLVGDNLAFAIEQQRLGRTYAEISELLFARGVYQKGKAAGASKKPLPLPRTTIMSAIRRIKEFDGVEPDREEDDAGQDQGAA